MDPRSLYPDILIPEVAFGQHVLNALQEHGDKVAWIDVSQGGEKYSFSRIRVEALKCANALHKEGIRRGDVIGLFLPNSCQQKVLVLSLALCGATIVPINILYTKDEVERQMQIIEPKLIFTTSDQLNKLKSCSTNAKIHIFGPNESENIYLKFLKDGSDKGVYLDGEIDIYNDDLFLFCSSGTTGPPKLIQITNYSLVATTVLMKMTIKRSSTNIGISASAMFHIASIITTFPPLTQGCCQVYLSEHKVTDLLQAILNYKVTHLFLLASHFLELVKSDLVQNYDVSSLVEIATGASPTSDEVKLLAKSKYGLKAITEIYGLTEAVPVCVTDPILSKSGSVGFLLPNTKMKVVDIDTRKKLGPRENGELLFKGPQVVKGYYKNPEATKNMFDGEGWLKSGDMGYFDDDGNLYITDRIKDVIKVHGVQVSSVEIESVLTEHPKIAAVGVIGVPDDVGNAGELPKAYIEKKEANLTTEEIHQFLEDKLADYKQLRGGVMFMDSLPRGGSGKIQKRVLREIDLQSRDDPQ
uniref:4-coumarate--CoA ligase 1-like isoform X1 n=1 Tax=Ciona intestinalis TaxID=7719 RepID=UPI0005217D78|nr:4-coumarate--CoA ligase 1-like isoform X1 [Ciona intestinalis]XP_026692913.1 4-coumarate--CoA ligase 1-like isoform X2 [Ciona intestinalis]|eukprot:XP_018670085.2 4-coumarate--CoA ligase 1-like isoform X1 [Ciona intestinalis]